MQESHMIWTSFQHKFTLTWDLYNYEQFFEMMLYRQCKDSIDQLVTVIEMRHIFGCVFNEKGVLDLKTELAIFKRVQDLINISFPLFRIRIIVCGLKVLPSPLREQSFVTLIDQVLEAQDYSDMVVGFDLVCEEDFNPGISNFLKILYEGKEKAA